MENEPEVPQSPETTYGWNPITLVVVLVFAIWLLLALVSTEFYVATGKGMFQITVPLLVLYLVYLLRKGRGSR